MHKYSIKITIHLFLFYILAVSQFFVKMASNNISTISEFYENKNIFITGGTGFLGKVLIDKLLRSLPNIGNIYILLRPKKGKNMDERIEYMLKDTLFDNLKETNINQLKKIIPIAGDCSELNLGISDLDYNILISKINVIFHMAASVRFDDSLQKAILLNTRGTREIVYLAKKCINLFSFVYVSTTYCNCVVGKDIEEKLYTPPGNWQHFIDIAEKYNPEDLVSLTHKLLGDHPNTYTFTKSLSEHVVYDLCINKFPTIICRPSIVISTLNEPIEGWTDNFNGPAGLLVSSGKGLNRCMYIENDSYLDYIPVDILIKSLVVAAWNNSLKNDISTIEILNCCSGKTNKTITLNNLIETCRPLSSEYPFNDILWLPKGGLTYSKTYAYISIIFFHLIPAIFFDIVLKLLGKKPIVTRLQTKIYIAVYTLRYFVREWDFENENFINLHFKILEDEKNVWGYDARHANIESFIINAVLGARRYLLKEPDNMLPAARKNFKRMYWLDKIVMCLLYSSLLYILYNLNIHNFVYNYLNNKLNFYIDIYSL